MRQKMPALVLAVILAAAATNAVATVRLEYSQTDKPKIVRFKAPDGRIFELSLKSYLNVGYTDMTLFRPGHRATATNLLEPKGRWHGIEPFELIAEDCLPSAKSVYGMHRDIPVRNYPFVFHVDIVCEGVPARDRNGEDAVAFRHVVLTAELRPAK